MVDARRRWPDCCTSGRECRGPALAARRNALAARLFAEEEYSVSRSAASNRRARPVGREFYRQPGVEIAPQLLGMIMVRQRGAIVRRARIVEVEAYLGPRDLASHSSKGRTARTEVMFGPPGHAYVYFIYGMYFMFNIVVGSEGDAHAILVRAAEPLDDW